MANKNQINEPEISWPVTFQDVEDEQLRAMLKATPAQRLAMAEELLEIALQAELYRMS